MRFVASAAIVVVGYLACIPATIAQPIITHTDESKVPKYTLPDPLIARDGKKTTSADDWINVRRPEILKLYETNVYGRSPARPIDTKFEVTNSADKAIGGRATRKQVTVYFSGKPDSPQMNLLLYLPNSIKGPVPVFLGLNFDGNHTVHADPDIKLSESWVRSNEKKGVVNNRATESARGAAASRWQVEMLLDRGYGVATVYCGDIDPDRNDFSDGVHPLFYKNGQTKPADDEWGTIAAWAWGLSRAMDYLESDKQVDATRVAVHGHSRLGKAALWAGATDERFDMVISNNSGEGGAALARRRFGETVRKINTSFPHWFCANYKKFNDNEDALPVDQHMLLALIAPRPLYVASATEDGWADPKGEFLSAVHAGPVYELLGKQSLGVASSSAAELPAADQPIHKTIGYHLRTGKHDINEYDWKQYLDFADLHWGKPR